LDESNQQSKHDLAWIEKYRPTTTASILGNEEAVGNFRTWLKQWTLKRKPTKACLLVGPSGVGKTTLARAGANDLRFRIVEMNASDVRTQKAIENLLAPASASHTLDSFTGDIKGNLILMDEVDGVFGREDRGGLGAILSAIKGSPIPIVLTANNVDDERFDDLRKACNVVRLYEIRPRLLVSLLKHIMTNERRSISEESVKEIVRNCYGDIRSAINDLQAIATTGIKPINSRRTRELDEAETVKGLFTSNEMSGARRVLNESELPLYRDELLLLIHDILPYVYMSPEKLARAYDTLSRADIDYARVGASRSRGMMPPPFNLPRRDFPPHWSLLPVALNELASVGLQKADNDVAHALEGTPRISRKTVERYQYRLWALDHLNSRIAKSCHTSKRKALQEITPHLIAIFRMDARQGREIAAGLDLEERDIDFLVSESKTKAISMDAAEVLDPTGFKLPFMGKDKFIALMRAGVAYDRSSGKFAVRRLTNLDSVEERIGDIISKPIKFIRPDAEGERVDESNIVKECYVDGRQVLCAKCEFVDDCPTHTITSSKFCLCDGTLGDSKAYEKYVEKNTPAQKLKMPTKPAKRIRKRKKP
jgi:replication factor C large subunit